MGDSKLHAAIDAMARMSLLGTNRAGVATWLPCAATTVREAAARLVSGEGDSAEVQESVKKVVEIARLLLAAGAKAELKYSTSVS